MDEKKKEGFDRHQPSDLQKRTLREHLNPNFGIEHFVVKGILGVAQDSFHRLLRDTVWGDAALAAMLDMSPIRCSVYDAQSSFAHYSLLVLDLGLNGIF